VIAAGLDLHIELPFKGNLDLNKLERVIQTHSAAKIPLVMITITNNCGGGQPVSLENICDASRLLKKYKIPLIFDACRFAENCCCIKHREHGYRHKSVQEIARDLFAYGDGCTMSAKKNGW
jgi:tryptophanase